MSNHSVIEHRSSYHFVKLEEDYLAICSRGEHSPHCKALILAILEHWMNTKHAKGEGDYAYLTMPEWIKHMYMLYERNVIEDCIHELLKEGLIMRRPIKRHGQKTFEYTLNVDAIHKLIKALPLKEASDTLPNLDNYLAHREKIKAEKKEAREKSRTSESHASEKSRTSKDSEKSRTASEKSRTSSTGRYVKNHSNIDSITKIITEIESTSADDSETESTQTDSLILSSTPSLSSQINPSELSPVVDKQPNSAELPIASPTTTKPTIDNPVSPNPDQSVQYNPVESVTTGSTSQKSYGCMMPKQVTLTAEERQIQEWWCAQKDLVLRPPKCTDKLKEHWSELAKYIHSLEEMTSLCQYTQAAIRDNPNRKDKTVYPGNLVDCLDRWKQKQAARKQPDKKQSTIVDPIVKMRAIREQFIKQEVS